MNFQNYTKWLINKFTNWASSLIGNNKSKLSEALEINPFEIPENKKLVKDTFGNFETSIKKTDEWYEFTVLVENRATSIRMPRILFKEWDNFEDLIVKMDKCTKHYMSEEYISRYEGFWEDIKNKAEDQSMADKFDKMIIDGLLKWYPEWYKLDELDNWLYIVYGELPNWYKYTTTQKHWELMKEFITRWRNDIKDKMQLA